MPRTNGGNINFNVNMTVQKNGLNQILKPLQQIQSQLNSMSTDKLSNEFSQAASAAKQLESIINSSWNDKLGQLNLDKFNQSIKNSYGSVEGLKNSLSGAGAAGQSAFNALASQVLNTNLQLKESNKLLDDMATSMANTVKWGITSSIFNNITSSIQKAYYYAKDLDESLNNIRIVTGDSADQMDRFAKVANNAAKDLGRSTLDYTNAALSFYQQGLSDEQVQARTQVTLKAQNITGVGTEMVDYLTSVWNGFKVEAEDTEEIVDKLAKVADSSASDMSQLAIAMSKVAATASVMGVDVDQLTAQLATVIATTRQAPESVGTAFKTIYSRLNDIKTGADDAEISLGNYSGKMAELGFNVLDANGRLRDTGQVMEQIGSRWNELSKEQQIYLAQTMGGMRQVTQVTALFENWTMYSQMLNTSLSAQGTLNEKNNIYLESTAAYMERLGAETERTYDILFNQDTVNGFAGVFTQALKVFNDYIEGIGGGANVFVNLGATVANIFNKQIGSAINNQIKNIELLKNNLAQIKAQQEWSQAALDTSVIGHANAGDKVSQAALEKQAAITQRTLQVRKALTQEQYNQLQNLQREVGVEQTRIDYLSQYQTILTKIGLSENSSTQVIQDNLNAKQQEVELQKTIADYIQLSLIPSQQLTEAQQARIQTAQNILLAEGEEAGILVGISSEQEKIITKLQTEALTDKELRDLLNEQNVLIIKQQQYVNKVKQAAEGRKAAQDGTLQQLKNQQAARERIISQQQDSAARQIAIQNAVRMTTGGVQALSALIGGISTALDETSTASEKLNGVWSAGAGTLSGIANIIMPGSGFLIQGITGLIKTGLEATGIWENWEKIFKSSAEKIEELKTKISDVNSQASTDNKTISSLQSIEEQWDTLYKKVTAYGLQSDQLTEDQKTRYQELITKFSEYNGSVIDGYDLQGNAIVTNQNALKETIELLKEQKRVAAEAAFGDVSQNLATGNAEFTSLYGQEKEIQDRIKNIKEKPYGVDASDINYIRDQFISEQSYYGLRDAIQNDYVATDLNPFLQNLGFKEEQFQFLRSPEDNELPSNFIDLIDEFNNLVADKDRFEQLIKNTEQIEILQAFFEDLKNRESEQGVDLNFELIPIEDILEQALLTSQGYSETNKELQKAQQELEVVQKNIEQLQNGSKEFNNSLLIQALQYGQGYKDSFIKLESSELYDDAVYKSVVDYISGYKFVEGLEKADVQNKQASSYEQILEIGQQFVDGLYTTLETNVDLIKGASEQSSKDIKQKITPAATETANEQRKAIVKSIRDAWLNNGEIQNLLEDSDQQNYILELIKSIYGVQDIQLAKREGKWVLDSVQTTVDEVLNGLPKIFEGSHSQTQAAEWLKYYFNIEDIQLISEELAKSGKTFESLDDFYEYINNFFTNLNNEEQTDGIIEKFDKVSTAISKVMSGKDLSYKEKINLMDQLGFSAEDLANSTTIIEKFEEVLEKLRDSENEDDLIKRAQGLSLIYNSFERITQALDNNKISQEEADSLWQDVFNNQLQSLNLTEEQLYEYAKASNLAFNDNVEKQKVLNLYKQNQNLATLSDTVNKAKTKLNEYTDVQKAIKDSQALNYLQALKTTLSNLGVNVDYQWIIDNIDKISQALKEGTFNAETFQTVVEGSSVPVEQEDIFKDIETKSKTASNAKSALTNLQNKTALSSEEAAALAYLEQEDDTLRQIAEEKGRNSKEYTTELQEQIQLQNDLVKAARQELITKLQIKKADLQKEKADLQKDLVSDQQYNNAELYLQSHPQNQGTETYQANEKIISDYQAQSESREQVLELDNQILEVEGQIIQQQATQNQNLKTQEQTAKSLKEAFEKMSSTLTSGGTLSDDEMKSFKDTLDYVIERYPELWDDAETLKETWLAGTEAYSVALRQISNALDELTYKELNTELDEVFSNIEDGLSDLKINVDPTDFENWADEVESFLNADKTITIAVHTDAQNEFNRITDELNNIYTAAGKIGENFVVAANDIRNLNNVFPGIVQGMKMLDDGSVQLNSNIVQRAIATAQATSGADAEAVASQLQNQSELLHAKAATYKKMAESAGVLAGTQTDADMTAAQARTNISKGLADIKASNAKLASQNEMDNEEQVANSSKDNSQIIARNWAGASQSSAQSIYSFARSAIANYNAVAAAAAAAAQGRISSSALSLPAIATGYTGSGGISRQASTLTGTQNALDDTNTSQNTWAQLQQQYQQMYQVTESAANDIDGMIAELGVRVDDVSRGLQNVSRGYGTKGPKSGRTKSPSSQRGSSDADADTIDFLDDERDRYHDINFLIKSIGNELDKVQKIEKKLYGKDLINNLNQQVNLLEKQIKAHQRKIELVIRERNELQNSLGSQGVSFDTSGAISNYNAALINKLNYVNTIISNYNAMSAEQQKNYKQVVDAAKQDYQNFKKQIEKYDTIVNETLPGLRSEIQEMRDKQIEIAISKFNMAVEIELDLSQAKRDWNEFKKKVIDQVREEDILGNTRSTLQNLFSYYDKTNNSKGLIPSLTNQVLGIMNQLDQINSVGFGNIYGDNKKQAIQDLQNYSKELMKSLENVEDIIKQVEDSFYDMVDAAQDAFDEQVKEYNFLSDLIDHDKKVIELLYGEEAFDKIDLYNQKQIESDKRELDFQKQQKDFWYAKMQAQKNRMINLDKQSNAYKEAEKRFKELEQHWLDAVKDFNSQVENSIQHLLDQYENNISIIFDDLNNTLTHGKGLEYIEQEWELISDNADDYYDKINSMYEIQKLQQAFEDAIEDNDGNLQAQKSLNNLMNQQLKMLKDKDKLTKYDVDRANLLLQIEVKRLALEQARNNKSKLRLRRDSQGNYSYQYVADEDQMAEAEQGLADARNSLYNLDKNQYIKNQNDILSVQQDFNEKLQKLYEQYPIWTEQAEAKRQLLIEQYGMKINGLVQQNQNIRLNLYESAFDELARLYDTDVDNFINMSRVEQDELMSNLIPQWNAGVQEMTDKIAGQGGFIPTCQEAFDELKNNTQNYEDSLRELQDQAGVSLNDIANGIDIDIDRTNELIDINDELINSYEEEWDALQKIIDQVTRLTQTYTTAKLEAIAAAKAANDYIFMEQEKAAMEAQKAGTANGQNGSSASNSSSKKPSSSNSSSKKPSSNTSSKKPSSNTSSSKNKNGASWSRIMEVYNLINSGRVGNDPYRKGNLSSMGYNSVEISKGQELINKVYPRSLGGSGMSMDAAKRAMGYKTGGYTGEWGKQGKIAILHEKELVLNAEDTKNILSAVQATRNMSQLLKLMSVNNVLSNALGNLTNKNISELDQNVHISATFPAVNSRVEIEEAFSNLINRASQYSFNTRK